MLTKVIKKIFGSKNDREVKKLYPLVERINEFESSCQNLSEDELRQKTAAWKTRFSQILDNDTLAQELEAILPEAYAVVKNAARRMCGGEINVRGHMLKWDMVHFDVQLIGGVCLHNQKIAEMATGEGKTLVATLPVFLNALSGRGVHVVTVNDYLATRDSEWMGALYRYLGLTVGCIQNAQPPEIRRQQYECDITYGTSSEFGFDYLRDNGMSNRKETQVQRGHYFAIVDEVDSILIDEARTPLIISGPAVVAADNQKYDQYQPRVKSLTHEQNRLCNRLLDDADKLLKEMRPEDGSEPKNSGDLRYRIGLLLYQARLGMPRSARLLKLMEHPDNLKMANRTELDLHADQTKKALYEAKEELFFAIDEKGSDADLTEKGRNFLNPKDPDAFMLPDIGAMMHEIDERSDLDPKAKAEEKVRSQQVFESKAQSIHTISQLVRAHCLYEKDVQYVVEENKVIIVDEHTGRKMPGRRWSDGLHQAVEAKEGVQIEKETQTLATITVQNYFRLYTKLAGMTGTAETEASEFLDIYNLGVMVIPTNQPCLRLDGNDTVYKTQREKFDAALAELQEEHRKGRPILVGTSTVETSERFSKILKKAGIIHSVLNAKFHQQEAEIVARAGQRGSVTIATNMAGRGTDIKLGPGVAELGGLHVIGTERHESRRIDRQLRGRCARQGDPGSSHFFISLEDNLMRLFASDWVQKVMERGLEDGQPLESPLLNRAIEQAQKRVESNYFQRRKRTLEYDDVMNKQREVIYGFRNEIIQAEDTHGRMMEILEEGICWKVEEHLLAELDMDNWNIKGFVEWTQLNFPLRWSEDQVKEAAGAAVSEEDIADHLYIQSLTDPKQQAIALKLLREVLEAYNLKASFEEEGFIRALERYTILSSIDRRWQEHLYSMDGLRESIGLRAYGQKDPLLEYKSEAFSEFESLMESIKLEIVHSSFRSASSAATYQKFLSHLPRNKDGNAPSTTLVAESSTTTSSSSSSSAESTETISSAGSAPVKDTSTKLDDQELASEVSAMLTSRGSESSSPKKPGIKKKPAPVKIDPDAKVKRNSVCPCGSGKKYKNCCGAVG